MKVDIQNYLKAAGDQLNRLGRVYVNLPLLAKEKPGITAEDAACLVCIAVGITDPESRRIRYSIDGDKVVLLAEKG